MPFTEHNPMIEHPFSPPGSEGTSISGPFVSNVDAAGFKLTNLSGLTVVGNTTKEIWIGQRTAVLGTRPAGSGSKIDPYDATTMAQFDALMSAAPIGSIIHILEGEYQFNASQMTGVSHWGVKSGWKIYGQGMGLTFLKAVGTVGAVSPGQGEDIYGIASFGARTDGAEVWDLTVDMNHSVLGGTAPVANSVPNYKTLSVVLNGSRTRIERVRSRNTYGSLVNNRESFALSLAYPSDASVSVDGLIADCIAELPQGDYASPYALHGISRSKVRGCKGYGTPYSNGEAAPVGFNTGGVNMVYSSHNDILDNEFFDCEGIMHHDTGPMDHLRVMRNKAVRAWFGIGVSPTPTGDEVDLHHNDINVINRVPAGASYGIILQNGGVADGTYTGIRVTHNHISTTSGGNPAGAGIIAMHDYSKVLKGHWESNIVEYGLPSFVRSDAYKSGNKTSTGGQAVGLEDNSMAAAEAPNVLGAFGVFANRTVAGGFAGYDIALSSNYTIVSGDVFQVAIYFNGTSGMAVSMLRKLGGSILDSNGLRDQNGLLGYDDISAFASHGYYVREFSLEPYIGQVLIAMNVGAGGVGGNGANAVTGMSRYFYRNARIIGTGGVVKREIYTDLGALFSSLSIGPTGSSNVTSVFANPFYPTILNTANPAVAGQLWSDSTDSYRVKVSQG